MKILSGWASWRLTAFDGLHRLITPTGAERLISRRSQLAGAAAAMRREWSQPVRQIASYSQLKPLARVEHPNVLTATRAADSRLAPHASSNARWLSGAKKANFVARGPQVLCSLTVDSKQRQ